MIKAEEGPHELSVKISGRENRYNRDERRPKRSDLSREDIDAIFADFGIDDTNVNFQKNGDIRVSITIEDSKKCVEKYTDLYDNLGQKVKGFFTKVFYQRDIEVLEKHADEAADEYYTKQKDRVKEKIDGGYNNKYEKPYKQREGGNNYEKRKYNDRRNDKDGKWNKYDNKDRRKEEDTVSTSSLSGFGKKGPKLFFNNKKKDTDLNLINSQSAKVGESHEKDKDLTAETPSKPIEEVKTVAKPAAKAEKAEDKKEAPTLKRRDTDNEFEIEDMKTEAKESAPKPKKETEYKKREDNYEKKTPVELKPRNSNRGKRGKRNIRGPYTNRFAAFETHLDNSESPEKDSQEEDKEDKEASTTLIGDRPEAKQFRKEGDHKRFSRGNYRGGYNNYNRYFALF